MGIAGIVVTPKALQLNQVEFIQFDFNWSAFA